MAKVIFMPKLSSTMSDGILLQWFKEEGDTVEVGERLFEIMTDKINIEVEAYDEGILLKKYFDSDDVVPVNQIIGYIGAKGEAVPDSSPGIAGQGAMETGNPEPENPEPENSEPENSEPKNPEPKNQEPAGSPLSPGEKLRATPAARKLARMNNLKLASIPGSGPYGRIHRKDVLHQIKKTVEDSKPIPLSRRTEEEQTPPGFSELSGSKQVPAQASGNRRKLDGMRKVIAERMAQSAYTAPHVTLTTDVDMTKAKELRASLLPIIEKQTGLRLSFTEILIKASAAALSRHPEVNVSIEGEEIVQHQHIHIGLAVAVAGGLLVPVVKDVPNKGLAEITREAKEIGQRARDHTLRPGQMQGATFTISNLGMYAVDVFTPIINQPESAILGVGRIVDKPAVVDGRIEIRPIMTLSLSFDHRAMDGAPAAAFLTEIKQILENPFELLV